MRLCVTTFFDDAFAEMGEISATTLGWYASRYGFDIHIERNLKCDRPAAWTKVILLQSLLDQDYDFILWVDADALFVRFTHDIRNEIVNGKDLFLVCHKIRKPIQPGAWLGLDVPNTGVMLLRNGDWSRWFLNALWDRVEYVNHQFWENAAALEVMGYHFVVDGSKRNDPVKSVLDHIGWLDPAWNSVPGIYESRIPIIHHYAGCSQRLEPMRRDFALAERARNDTV